MCLHLLFSFSALGFALTENNVNPLTTERIAETAETCRLDSGEDFPAMKPFCRLVPAYCVHEFVAYFLVRLIREWYPRVICLSKILVTISFRLDDGGEKIYFHLPPTQFITYRRVTAKGYIV